MNLRPLVPNEVLRRTILENSAIFVAFANVCSHSVRAKLWPNLWPENDRGGVQNGGPLPPIPPTGLAVVHVTAAGGRMSLDALYGVARCAGGFAARSEVKVRPQNTR